MCVIDEHITFKSFYYCLGTTSFRMQNFNQKIEQQLDLLDKFWKKPEYKDKKWESNETIQEAYYNFIKENGFLKEGDAPRKAKDARQKTSGMRDIGLIDDNRRLTAIGRKLLEIARNGDFTSNNILQIPRDSYIYLQQLLKTYIEVNKTSGVRPFILLSRLLKKFNYLSNKEFTYLFPLCINEQTTEFVEKKLQECRGSESQIEEIITSIFMNQQNYKDALAYFISTKAVCEETFCKIGLNRKSKDYDRVYLSLYEAIRAVYFDGDKSNKAILKLYNATNIPNLKSHWRKFIFKTSSATKLKKSPVDYLYTNRFSNLSSEIILKTVFFKTMHLIKIKKTLEDYFDLNRRYLKISDTLLFADNQVKFDLIPKYYFSLLPNEFYNLAFKKAEKLTEEQSLEEISPSLRMDEVQLLKMINKKNKTSFTHISEISQFVASERLARFNRLIDERFSDEQLIYILQLIRKRSDKEIQSIVTDGADIPTIFEYILGIAWYKISERKGDILSFMNLSLEADLLPKTHAGGGEADLVFQYGSERGSYPAHTLLIEATLSESTNQRRMEMEPVSRHLGEYILTHKMRKTYCVFITNYLHINVISDFRNRRKMEYYGGRNAEEVVTGMMITPLDVEMLIFILRNKIKYSQLYKLFHEMQEITLPPKEWFVRFKNILYREEKIVYEINKVGNQEF